MEISRWRKPPEPTANAQPPRQGRRKRGDSGTPAGVHRSFSAIRWLAPPANFRSPSGRQTASTNFARLNRFKVVEVQQTRQSRKGRRICFPAPHLPCDLPRNPTQTRRARNLFISQK